MKSNRLFALSRVKKTFSWVRSKKRKEVRSTKEKKRALKKNRHFHGKCGTVTIHFSKEGKLNVRSEAHEYMNRVPHINRLIMTLKAYVSQHFGASLEI